MGRMIADVAKKYLLCIRLNEPIRIGYIARFLHKQPSRIAKNLTSLT